jgi:Uma2 family endonuclease
MASVTSPFIRPSYGYPTSDGKPMTETDQHRKLMFDLIETLGTFFRDDPNVYVSGNLILCYVPGNRRRHLSPDVFFVRGVPKGDRLNYLTWIEGKGPDLVVELTSSSTRHADTNDKFVLYRDTLRVPEYFLFDPLGDYLVPPLHGYRLHEGQYLAIEPLNGRLPSVALGLHLEGVGDVLRLWDPAAERQLPTTGERAAEAEAARLTAEQAQRRAEAGRRAAERRQRRAEEARLAAEQAQRRAEDQARQSEDELARLRRELDNLRRQPPPPPGSP